MVKTKTIYLYILFNVFYIIGIESNYVCNGDFQGHTLSKILDQPYIQKPSNYSCWYNNYGGEIELKKKLFPPATTTAELVLIEPYILCQNINLSIGKYYKLSFDTVNCLTMTYSTVIVTINGIWLMNVTTYNQLSISHGQQVFISLKNINKLCFRSVFNMNRFLYPFNGPCIDNVTIVDMKNQTNLNNTVISGNTSNINNQVNFTNLTEENQTNFNNISQVIGNLNNSEHQSQQIMCNPTLVLINCSTSNKQTLSTIFFSCTYQNFDMVLFFKIYGNLIQVSFQGQLQKQVQIINIQHASFQIEVQPKRAYYLRNIAIYFPNESLPSYFSCFIFQISINGDAILLTLLDGKQKAIVETISSSSEYIVSWVQKLYLILKVSFFSYFLIGLISFWNLSLMYNFLEITTVPSFSKNFFERLEKLLFKIDSIIEWLSEKIPQLSSILSFQDSAGRQKMDGFKNGYAWFGFFGFSSSFLSNNIQQLLLFTVLCIKMGLLFIIGKIQVVPLIIKSKIPKGIKIVHKFILELIGLQTFMIISAGTVILNLGYLEYKQKTNSIIQILTLFICLITIPLFFLIDIQAHSKKKPILKQIKTQCLASVEKKKINSYKRKIYHKIMLKSINQILQFIPFLTIPLLILFESRESFLLVNTIILLLRFYWFIKFYKKIHKNMKTKFLNILNILIWMFHHFAYVAMWIIQKVYQNKIQLDEKQEEQISYTLKILGFITIFTIVSGGILQIFVFIIQIISAIYKYLKKLFKYLKKEKPNKIKPEERIQIKVQNQHTKKNKYIFKIHGKAKVQFFQQKNDQPKPEPNNKIFKILLQKFNNKKPYNKQSDVIQKDTKNKKKQNKIYKKKQYQNKLSIYN